MASVASEALERGREASRRYDWTEAFEALTEADTPEGGLPPEDLEVVAEAAWWTGRLDACISARERAFRSYLDAENRRRAALVAMALAKDYYAKGSSSIGSAWVKRAERLLGEDPDCVEMGWLHRLRSVMALEGAGDFETALAEARRGYDVATRFGDRDLLAVSLHDQGRALVSRGEVEEGMTLIDEATAPAISGELSPYNTGVVYCNTITACKELADFRRAGDWTEAAKRWCERQSIAGFPGMCRVYRASIMMLRGAWPEAEMEARQACAELPEFNRSYAAEAFYELGEIRLRAGDLEAAEDAFKQAHELGRDPQPGLALLRLAQADVEAAAAAIRRVASETTDPSARAGLLPAYAEIMLVVGDVQEAHTACRELKEVSARYESGMLGAMAAHAQGAVGLSEGDARAALPPLRRAWQMWQELEVPYEAARVRALLGQACRDLGDDDTAALELEAARSTFEQLGAAPDLARLDSLIRRTASVEAHELTARELQVLRLVASGATNKAIAAELVLSERTVDRHVSNIFAKLGVSSRAAATACAYEHQLI